MKIKVARLLLVLAMGMMIGAPLSWAKETSYNYVIAYSYKDKIVYHSPIFTQQVKGESAGDEEYVFETSSMLKMESAFQAYVQRSLKYNSPDLTVSARLAYKTQEIAKRLMDAEVGDFRYKGFEIKEATGFSYSD